MTANGLSLESIPTRLREAGTFFSVLRSRLTNLDNQPANTPQPTDTLRALATPLVSAPPTIAAPLVDVEVTLCSPEPATIQPLTKIFEQWSIELGTQSLVLRDFSIAPKNATNLPEHAPQIRPLDVFLSLAQQRLNLMGDHTTRRLSMTKAYKRKDGVDLTLLSGTVLMPLAFAYTDVPEPNCYGKANLAKVFEQASAPSVRILISPPAAPVTASQRDLPEQLLGELLAKAVFEGEIVPRGLKSTQQPNGHMRLTLNPLADYPERPPQPRLRLQDW